MSEFIYVTNFSSAFLHEPKRLSYVPAENCEKGFFISLYFGCLPNFIHIVSMFLNKFSSGIFSLLLLSSRLAFSNTLNYEPNLLCNVEG